MVGTPITWSPPCRSGRAVFPASDSSVALALAVQNSHPSYQHTLPPFIALYTGFGKFRYAIILTRQPCLISTVFASINQFCSKAMLLKLGAYQLK